MLFLGMVDQADDQLAMLGCDESVEEVNGQMVNNLSSFHNIQSESILSRPSIPVPESMRSSATRTLMTRLTGRW